METTLIVSQIIFYSVTSLAIILIGILFSIEMYHLICMTKELKTIVRDFHNLTNETQERIKDIAERLSNLPILSFLFKKKREHIKKDKKGRKKN